MVVLAFMLGLAIMPAMVAAQVLPSLVPNIDFNVKGSTHKVCIDWGSYNSSMYQTDWWLVPGEILGLDEIVVLEPSGPNPYSGNESYAQTIKEKGLIDNVSCIELQAMKVGDVHIYVDIIDTRTGLSILEQPLQAEKKWGELDHTELDVNPEISGVQNTEAVEFPYGSTGIYEETITDTVYAWHPEWGVQLVDNAIVHWWLVKDTGDNQAWVDSLMAYLFAHNGTCNPEETDYWAACGKYVWDEIGNPWDYINNWATSGDRPVDTSIFSWNAIDVPGAIESPLYAWATSDDGIATATLSVNVTNLIACTTYKVMIVVLVAYPGGSTPQDDPFHGENIICLEKGKKQFHKGKAPEISEVKTPQLRWAGEKIVLEKDWEVAPSYTEDYVDLGDGYWADNIWVNLYAAIYNLEEGSVGNLEPISDAAGFTLSVPGASGIYVTLDYLGLPAGAQQVICPLGGYYYDFIDGVEDEGWGGYSDTQCILSTQQSGQADVNAALYEVSLHIYLEGSPGGPTTQIIEAAFNGPVMNYGFLVYFLEFEDITLAEDITSLESLADVEPDESTPVAVRVRGFFDYRYSHLMATTREEKPIDLDGDGVADKILPAGRYVLPDDWWLIAGTKNVSLRPNFDLMDQANLDNIVSPVDTNFDHEEELGPYSPVRTVEPLDGVAEYPTIGPFSTYQLWSKDDMWITSANVPSSAWWTPNWKRNTVVPDGLITKWDAPMPQALVIFNVVSNIGTVSGLDKGALEGYGFEWSGNGPVYQSPYYAVEIPANWQIPPGYNWLSWARDPGYIFYYFAIMGPYDFWKDLGVKSIISNTDEDPIDPKDVEVYSDNHGIAGVSVDPLGVLNMATITATAEYPYTPKRAKYGPIESEPIDIGSGVIPTHLDPDFEATPRNGTAPLTVSFDPSWTKYGTPPYIKAEWNFGDGSAIETFTGSWNTPADIPMTSHTYYNTGNFTVRLTITDSSLPLPQVNTEEKKDYITVVGGIPVTVTWNLLWGLDEDPTAINIYTYNGVAVTLADVDATMPDGLMIWYYGGPGVGNLFYKQGWGAYNTLTTLAHDAGVIGLVPTASVWDIPQG